MGQPRRAKVELRPTPRTRAVPAVCGTRSACHLRSREESCARPHTDDTRRPATASIIAVSHTSHRCEAPPMILLLNGPINSGKTTTAHALPPLLPRAAHVEVDALREFVPALPLAALLLGQPILGAILYGTYGAVRAGAAWLLILGRGYWRGDFTLWLLRQKSLAHKITSGCLFVLGVVVAIVIGLWRRESLMPALPSSTLCVVTITPSLIAPEQKRGEGQHDSSQTRYRYRQPSSPTSLHTFSGTLCAYARRVSPHPWAADRL